MLCLKRPASSIAEPHECSEICMISAFAPSCSNNDHQEISFNSMKFPNFNGLCGQFSTFNPQHGYPPLSFAHSGLQLVSGLQPLSTPQILKKTKLQSNKRACRLCYRHKKRCEGGTPCQRCKDRNVVCESRVTGKRKKARIAALVVKTEASPPVLPSIPKQPVQPLPNPLFSFQQFMDMDCKIGMLQCVESQIKNSTLATQVKEWTADPSGSRDVKLYWNVALQKLMGYNMEQALSGCRKGSGVRFMTYGSVCKLTGLMGSCHGSTFITAIHKSGYEFAVAIQWKTVVRSTTPYVLRQCVYLVPMLHQDYIPPRRGGFGPDQVTSQGFV